MVHAPSTRQYFANRKASNARRNVGALVGGFDWNLLLDELAVVVAHPNRGAKARIKIGLGARGPY